MSRKFSEKVEQAASGFPLLDRIESLPQKVFRVRGSSSRPEGADNAHPQF